jgi:DNA-binding NarL/FixJ family response regulator
MVDIRLLVVADQPIFTEGIISALTERGCDVIGTATSGVEAIKMARAEPPDIVLLDTALSDEDAVSVGRTIMETSPDTKVIAFVDPRDIAIQRTAVEAGFHGVLTKDFSAGRLVGSILLIASGHVVIPQETLVVLNLPERDPDAPEAIAARLTEREREILSMLASGMATGQIALALTLSPNTVRSHIQNIRGKLKVHSRLDAVLFAFRHGVVESPADLAGSAN